ncbi:MAG: RNA polymerase subunit sigma-70 [Planctomycetes bacterium]|nr:RNA polymerase subunit sigma-70 [Planctomycetota bacterium]
MSNQHSETNWLRLLKTGDDGAARLLWERYVRRLTGLARRKIVSGPCRMADEEDVALSAFHSFCRGAAAERFDQLEDRSDLWQVLAMITTRKALRQLQRERAQKRGGGEVRGESAFRGPGESSGCGAIQEVPDGSPSPEYMAIVDEEFQRLLDLLPDQTLRDVVVAKLAGYTNAEIAERQERHVRGVERKLQLIRKHWLAASESQYHLTTPWKSS